MDILPSADTYELPLNIEDVLNLQRDVVEKMPVTLTPGMEEKLTENGFVAVPSGEFDRFKDAYIHLGDNEIPIFITTDSTLHLYHLFFDQILKFLEVKEFTPMLQSMLGGFIETSVAQYKGAGDDRIKEAALRNVAYFSVPAKILDGELELFDPVKEEVMNEIALIEAHAGPGESYIFNEECEYLSAERDCRNFPADPGLQHASTCYCEDFSQYVPRGHYTQSEDLKKYFKAMMYLGRIGLRIKADMETIQAVLATDALKFTKVLYDGQEAEARDLWHRIYKVTGFLVGAADDLTYYEYDRAAVELFGEGFNLAILADEGRLAALRDKLGELREPAILSGFVSALLDETEETMGWRFMGQRFAPDSYVLGQEVFKHVGPDPTHADYAYVIDNLIGDCAIETEEYRITGNFESCDGMNLADYYYICCSAILLDYPDVCRLLPKGLDVMSVMGSPKADEILQPDRGYCGYPGQTEDLKQEFSRYSVEDWRQNVYWTWLYALQPLLEVFGDGYPAYMTTGAWHARSLDTALTSWAELRHDTILYVKQSYTSMGPPRDSEPPLDPKYYGYVEAVPLVYARLHDLTVLTRAGLEQLAAMPEGLDVHLDAMADLLMTLKAVAEKELTAAPLSEEEYDMIMDIGEIFDRVIKGLASAVTIEAQEPESCGETGCTSELDLQGDAYKTTLVADVHTDGNTEKVLEEGSGKIDWMLVVNKMEDGTLGVSVAPIFTYYEFAHPMSDRLTDEKWRRILDGQEPGLEVPSRPAWMQEYYAP